MGLILRATSVANSGNSILVQGSVLSHAQGDGNFMYLLTNMSGSSNSITGSTGILGGLNVTGGITGSFSGSLIGTASYASNVSVQTIGTSLYSTNPSTSGFSTSNGIFLGNIAGYNATNADQSIMIGVQAGYLATYASNSTFIGTISGQQATNADKSTFIGKEAGYLATNASQSVFLGTIAGSGATNALQSVFIGVSAGQNSYNASGSVFIGQGAGAAQTTNASYCTLIGYQVGQYPTLLGSNNIIIGTNVTLPSGTKDSINIGGIIFATGSYFNPGTPSSTAVSNAKVGIGISTPSASLHVSGTVMFPNLTTTSSVSNVVMINTTTGQLYYTASSAIASGSLGGNVTGSGVANYISMWSGSTSLTTSSIFQSGSNIGIGVTTFDNTNPEKLLVSGSTINTIVGKANINSYTQLNITNKNAGSSASSDVVATNDTGTENGNFINMGINSSTFNGTIGAANDAYLYNTGSTLWIGNTSPGISGSIKFFAGNNATTTAMMISSSGNIGIGTTNPTSSLDVNGDLTVKHIVGKTGPLAVTLSTGAGTGATYSITGSDLAGVITVTTGTSPAANATIVLLNYFAGLTSPGYPLITPANLNSSVLNGSGASGAKQVYVDTGANPSISFTIKSSTTGLTAGTIYKWYYHIMQ